MSRILAGDIGATKTRLTVFSVSNNELTEVHSARYDSRAFGSLGAVTKQFLADHPQHGTIDAACFGLPGPIINRSVTVTNLPWKMTEQDLSLELGIPTLKLVNDLAATAAGIPYLKDNQIFVLNPGVPPTTPRVVRAVLAPGTGLGQAALISENNQHTILPSQGGHVDFAPQTDDEIALLRYLRERHGHVSSERIISGIGIANIYAFLRDTGRAAAPAALEERIATHDPVTTIAQSGLAGEFPITVTTLNIFAQTLGYQAGNLALSYLSNGGVYLCGGLPPKLLPKLKDGATVAAYLSKGREEPVVRATPLYVVLDEKIAVLGAGRIAHEALG